MRDIEIPPIEVAKVIGVILVGFLGIPLLAGNFHEEIGIFGVTLIISISFVASSLFFLVDNGDSPELEYSQVTRIVEPLKRKANKFETRVVINGEFWLGELEDSGGRAPKVGDKVKVIGRDGTKLILEPVLDGA